MIEVRTEAVVCRATNRGTITFGRSSHCTIKLDFDRKDDTLSRTAGVFRWEGGHWVLDNMSSRLDLTVEIIGGLDCLVRPGAYAIILPSGSGGRVAIQTKETYTLDFSVDSEPVAGSVSSELEALVANETATSDMAEALKLNDIDLRMLAAMCEPRLREPSVGPLSVPSAQAICDRLNISPGRAERIVDSLAIKFSAVVDGLFGNNDRRATDRRQRIADFAFRTRCVTFADLRRLTPAATQ